MKRSIKEVLPFAEAFARILYPFAEVIVHDLAKDQIEAIYNPLSRREVGDSSYLDRVNLDSTETIIGPYEKTNWDGRSMKSISIIIRNLQGVAEGFLCVNIDVSVFESANQILVSFLENNKQMNKKTELIFKEDLYEKINLFVRNFCRDNQVSISALSRSEKKEIICTLLDQGAFNERNAANYVGRVLGISRATVYNYLKEEVDS
jgi:D-arginine utilization repressor